MNKFDVLTRNFGVKVEMFVYEQTRKIKNKLVENSGADGSTEKTSWLIVALIIGAIVIGLVNKFAPEFGEMVMDKIKEFFNFATVS